MSEDGLLEEDIWEYRSIWKPKLVCQNSEVISTNVHQSTDGTSKSQSNRKTSEVKDQPNKIKQRPRQRGIQTPLKQDQNLGVSNSDHVVHSQERISSSAKPKKNCKNQSPVNVRPSYEGSCPSCQMPFSLLLGQTPEWHVTECLDSAGTAEKECPDGLLCTSNIPSHYKRYSHFLLAARRAGDHLVDLSSSLENNPSGPGVSQPLNCNVSSEDGIWKDLHKSMGEPPDSCVLSQQSSSNMNCMDAGDIKTSSLENVQDLHQHRIQSTSSTKLAVNLGALSQETQGSYDLESQCDSLQLDTLVSESDLSDCDISYSPLNTDEEKSTEGEGEEEEEETQIKHPPKPLFVVKSPEEKNGRAGSCTFNKPVCTSQLREIEHNGVKIAINECREASAIFPTMDGVPKSLFQGSTPGRILSSTNVLDLVNRTIEELAPPVAYKESGEKCAGLNSSVHNAGECEGSNSNWKVKTESSVKNKLLLSNPTEESIGMFWPCQADSSVNSCNIVKTIPATCGNTQADNNSYSITEGGGTLSNSIAVSIFPNSVSQKLPRVSATSLKVQAVPAKELKQMDIGVFFGLRPKAKMESDQKQNLCENAQTLNPCGSAGKRSRFRKRRAEGSSADSETVTESSGKTSTPVEPAFGGHRRWQKRFRESWNTEGGTRKKQCPFYKKIPGTSFVVDAFQYGEIEGCTGYFLSHFHSDHYGGLTKKFTFPIYCNKITGNFVKRKLQVQEQYVHVLPMDTECIVNGIKVVLLDANHCPGAAMILFVLPDGTVTLHTGDFRANPSMERYPFLIGKKIHSLYLDTTYCSPEYTFPSQQEVVQFAVNTAFETVTSNPRTLVVCGTYSVGKEKVFLAIAEVLGSKVSVSKEKYKTLQCLESAEIDSLITLDWNNTLLHLLPMMQINFKCLQNHLNKFSDNFDHILAFKPTGWTYSDKYCSLSEIQPQTRGKITIYGIPYSEHSSFLEMKQFVQWLKPHKIIPTVNVGNWKARNEMEKHFRDWKKEAAGEN